MGRVPKGKEFRIKGTTSKEVMKRAVEQHLLHGHSIRRAAKDSKVAYPTLNRYVKKYLKNSSTSMEPNYGVNKIFTTGQETSLLEYISDCGNKFYGMTGVDCRRIAYQMARINNINSMPASWVANRMAGIDWVRGFKARHPFELAKNGDATGAVAFDREKFFINLNELPTGGTNFVGGGVLGFKLDEALTTTVRYFPKTESELASIPDLTILKTETLEEVHEIEDPGSSSDPDYKDPLGLSCHTPSDLLDIDSDGFDAIDSPSTAQLKKQLSDTKKQLSDTKKQLSDTKKQLQLKENTLKERDQKLKERDTRIETLTQVNNHLSEKHRSMKVLLCKMRRKVLEMNSIVINGDSLEDSGEGNSL